MTNRDLENVTFEDAIAELEKVVDQLESNTLPLEKALELFKTGIILVNHCNAKLEEAEGTIEILLKNRDGQLEEMPFNIEHEERSNEF